MAKVHSLARPRARGPLTEAVAPGVAVQRAVQELLAVSCRGAAVPAVCHVGAACRRHDVRRLTHLDAREERGDLGGLLDGQRLAGGPCCHAGATLVRV